MNQEVTYALGMAGVKDYNQAQQQKLSIDEIRHRAGTPTGLHWHYRL